MKNIFRFFLMMVLLVTTSSLQAQISTADSLVHKIFTSLQAKDEKAFVALFPNPQQLGQFMRSVMELAFKSEEMKAMMALDEKSKNMNVDSLINAQVASFSSPEMVEKMQTEISQSFQKLIEKGEKKGVKWNEAKLTGFTIDSSAAKDENAESFEKLGIKEARGVIDFSVGESAYQMSFSKMLYLKGEGGWFGAEFPQLARKGESLAPDQVSKDDEQLSEAPKQGPKATNPKSKAAPKKTGATKAPVRKKA